MNPENTPTQETIVSPDKSQALVTLEQNAAYGDMTNEQYEATRASIEAAHAIIEQTPAEAEASQLLAEFEAQTEATEERTDAAAIAAERQRAAAHRAIDLAAGSADGMDEDQYKAAHAAVDAQYAQK